MLTKKKKVLQHSPSVGQKSWCVWGGWGGGHLKGKEAAKA